MASREHQEVQAVQAEPEVASGVDRRRSDREKRAQAVKRKYDFSIIRHLRQQKALTIEKFARICGLSYAPISRIETNLIKPNLETLDKIAEGLGISTYNLVAMAERREAQIQKARDLRCGGFTFRLVSAEGIEAMVGEGRKGAVAADPEFHHRDYVTLLIRTGTLEIKINDKVNRVAAGETITLECVRPDHYLAVEDTDFLVLLHSRR